MLVRRVLYAAVQLCGFVCSAGGWTPTKPPAVASARIVAGSPAAVGRGEAVAIVGSRRATPYGLEVSRSLGRGLAAAGLPVRPLAEAA